MEEFDAIIIGSGAGGAPVAHTLVRAGKRVLMLEKGPRMRTQDDLHGNPLSDFKRDELYGFGPERIITVPGMANTGASFYPSLVEPDLNDEPHLHSQAPEDIIWVEATYSGRPDEAEAVKDRMAQITARRETTQPIREKTGGSTFKNPPGHSSWKLVDDAGWRGKLYGGAKFSELHSNFLINTGEATAADLEGLGDAVRADVKAKFGIELEWEVKRVGRAP